MDIISQIMIMVLGASAIWFVGRTEDWKRWGYIFGICSQPFWFYTTIVNEQWGILVMTLFYTYSWAQGCYNYWIKAKKDEKGTKVLCGCGGEEGTHLCGVGKCFRYVVTDENEIPRNRRLCNDPESGFKKSVFIWDVGDGWCTDFALFHQRLYSFDEKTGQWTRPKSKCSKNSIKG